MSAFVPDVADRWRLAVRAAADPARLGRALDAGTAGVGALEAAPGTIAAQVAGSRSEPYRVTLRVDLVGPSSRARWLAAMGLGPGDAPPDPRDPRIARAIRAGVDDPVPGPGAIWPRCSCPDAAPSGWCKHALAVAEAAAQAMEDDGARALWRARGLEPDEPPAATVAPVRAATDGEAAVDAPASPDATAFWGDEGRWPELPAVAAWVDAPAALQRLGPLPAARGQQAAVEPIATHYRRVRDAVAARVGRAHPGGPVSKG